MPVPPAIATNRENLVCIGWAKQAAWNTPLAATNWWKWLDGTEANPETQIMSDREGDTSPWKSFVMKTSEIGQIKIMERARPRTMGCALQALLGSGSDTYTAAVYNSTIATGSPVTAGQTTCKLTADAGIIGSAVVFVIGIDTPTPEVVTLDLTTRTTPNFTYTIAAGGTFQQNHAALDPIQNKATHVLKRQLGAYEPYTIEVQYGANGTAPFGVEQFIDAVCTEVKITSQKGQPVLLEHTWYSGKFARKAAFTSPVTYEGSGIPGVPGAPYVWSQAQNQWTLNGSSINGLLESFQLSLKNTTDPHDLITDSINAAYFTPELFDVEGAAQILFTNFDHYFKTYYGNITNPSSTASDSYIVGTGSLASSWIGDLVNSFSISLPSTVYMAAKKAPPKASAAKAMRQAIAFSALRTPAVNDPFSITLNNTYNQAY